MLSNRLYILDGMRFLLALQVLFCHYTLIFTEVAWGAYVHFSGRLAVLGFFILSGFLMHETALNSTPVEFAVKRIIRLCPAFIICSFLTFFVCTKIGLNLNIYSYVANLTFFPGFLFNDKFLDPVYWTLQHEIIFYFHIFLLLLTNKFKNLLFRVMYLWLFLCLAWSIVLGYEFYYGAYYKLFLLISYGPLFIIGVLLSYLRHNFSYKATVAVLIAILLSIHNERVHSFPSIQNITAIDPIYIIIITLSVIVPIIIILLSTSSHFNLIKLPRLKNIFVFLGGISYPMYLLHSRISMELVNAGILGKNFTSMLTMIFAVFAVATIIYKFELKIRIYIKNNLYNKFYLKFIGNLIFFK